MSQSVTRILAAAGIAVMPPIPRERMALYLERGRQVHAATEEYDRGELDWLALPPDLEGYLHAYQQALELLQPKILACEENVADAHGRYHGRLDRRWQIGTDYWLVDIKCGSVKHRGPGGVQRYAPPSTGPQLAAYEGTLEPGLYRRAALVLTKKGAWHWEPHDDPLDHEIWDHALALAVWRQGCAIITPEEEELPDDDII